MRIGGGGGGFVPMMHPMGGAGNASAARFGGAQGGGPSSGPASFVGQGQPSATPGGHKPPTVTGMDVMKHLFKGLMDNLNPGGGVAAQGASQAPAVRSSAPATTQPSDSSLMTYARKDVPKFMASGGNGPQAPGGPGGAQQVNPFMAAALSAGAGGSK